MARALWSGSISFGLVNIPVKLVGATKDRDLHFHMLHAKDGARVRFQRMCAKEEKPLENDEIVKGYEVADGQYVTFTEDELEAADPQAARTIEISDFVDLDAIDPSYYDKTYYLIPDKNADKAYALLHAALAKSKKVGIARMVMREKEYLAAIRSKGGVLVLETMHFADEVVPETAVADEVRTKAKDVDQKQLAMAQQLIESLSLPFDPERYENKHRAKLRGIIDQKAAGHDVVMEPESRPTGQTADLMAALEKSLEKSLAKAKKKAKAAA